MRVRPISSNVADSCINRIVFFDTNMTELGIHLDTWKVKDWSDYALMELGPDGCCTREDKEEVV